MKSWMQNWKTGVGRHFIIPILTMAMVGSVVTYDFMKAVPAKAAAMAASTTTPLDDNNVGALLALDQAMETLAARVTPAIVNVTVTSRATTNVAEGELPEGLQDSPFGQFFGQQFGRQFGHQGRPQQPRVALHVVGFRNIDCNYALVVPRDDGGILRRIAVTFGKELKC
jgi:S1-C subfamily serine protease